MQPILAVEKTHWRICGENVIRDKWLEINLQRRPEGHYGSKSLFIHRKVCPNAYLD